MKKLMLSICNKTIPTATTTMVANADVNAFSIGDYGNKKDVGADDKLTTNLRNLTMMIMIFDNNLPHHHNNDLVLCSLVVLINCVLSSSYDTIVLSGSNIKAIIIKCLNLESSKDKY